MSTTKKILLVPVLALGITIGGFGAALASEVSGTVGTGGSGSGGQDQQGSYTDGGLVATVSDGSSQAPSGNSSTSGSSGSTVARSSASRAYRANMANSSAANDPIIIIDGSSVASAGSYSGTGGGYDQSLEDTLSRINGDSGYVSPSDAVAFNNARLPAGSDLAAATADSGMGTGRIATAVVLGLSLIGLAGYAVNALVAYRRENDL